MRPTLAEAACSAKVACMALAGSAALLCSTAAGANRASGLLRGVQHGLAVLEALTGWFCIPALVLQVRDMAFESPAVNISHPHGRATTGLLSCASCRTHSWAIS